jgi:hypothetical protein
VNRIHLTALLYVSEITWTAQGLEFNVAIQGRNLLETKTRFMDHVSDQVMLDLHNRPEDLPLYRLGLAPKKLFAAAVTSEAYGPRLPVWIHERALWRNQRVFVYVQFLKEREPASVHLLKKSSSDEDLKKESDT